LNLAGPEMSLLPLGIARIFLASRLAGWSSVGKILGALKFVSKPVQGVLKSKTPRLASIMTSSLAKITTKTAKLSKRGMAAERLKNIRSIASAKAGLVEKKGLAKLFGSVTKMATHSVMWLPWFAGDIVNVVKDSGLVGKNASEDQVAKQLELFTPEQLEEMTTKAAAKTEERFASMPALGNQMDQTAEAMNNILFKSELSANDTLFKMARAEIQRLSTEKPAGSVPCVAAEDSLVEESVTP
jgi:hypothetical protein